MKPNGVSVVIPAYNCARTIGRAIDSLLTQTSPPDEILVVDDGSSEPLEPALEHFRGRVTYLRKPNGGAASARNFGIERCQGEFIAFLDADDRWEPPKWEHQREVLYRHPEIGLVASRYVELEPGSSWPQRSGGLDRFFNKVLNPSGLDLFELMWEVMTSTVVIRRAALSSLRFEAGLEPAEDRDLWIRLIKAHPVFLIAEPLVTVFLEPGSLSRSDHDQGYAPMIKVLRRYADLLDRRDLNELEARVFRGWAGSHLAEGRPKSALRPAIRRLVRQPASPEGWLVLLKSALLASVHHAV